MKIRILILLMITILVEGCKKSNENILITKNNQIKQDKINSDTIQIHKLPFGNELLVKEFTKNSSLGFLNDNETNLLEFENSKFLTFYEKIFRSNVIPFGNIYKYSQKNILDFGLNYISPSDSIKTYQGYYSLSNRLPDIGNNKIFIMNSINKNKNFHNIDNCIDLIIYNKKGDIINSLNLGFRLYASDNGYYNFFGDIAKYFYIDNNYIIHVKYFMVNNDSNSSLLLHAKYKIHKDGSIVRYFDQENGNYKSEIEEGRIKNNVKDGEWKEALNNFQTNYCLKKYNKGIIIDNIEVVNIDDNKKKSSFFIDKNTYLPLIK